MNEVDTVLLLVCAFDMYMSPDLGDLLLIY